MARMATDAMTHLRSIGLANPAQDRLIEAGRRAGAFGGKLSGAGAGGAFFLIAPDEVSAHAIARQVDTDAREAGIDLRASARVVCAGAPSAGA
jgi:mevalonate kinase